MDALEIEYLLFHHMRVVSCWQFPFTDREVLRTQVEFLDLNSRKKLWKPLDPMHNIPKEDHLYRFKP